MFSLLNHVQESLSGLLSPSLAIIFWSLVLSIVSMLIYRITSPQAVLKGIKTELNAVKEQMKDDDHMEENSLEVASQLLTVSLKKVFLTFLPALLSGLPILLMIGFLSYHFDRAIPSPGEQVLLEVSPHVPGLYLEQEYISVNDQGNMTILWPKLPQFHLQEESGSALFTIDSTHPQYYLHKRQWWNALLPSPYGYLDNNAEVDEIFMNLPMKEYLSFGPTWLRSWWSLFVPGMLFFSLSIKSLFRIE